MTFHRNLACLGALLLVVATGVACSSRESDPAADDLFGWSQAEVVTLESMWLSTLPPLPPDPSNAVADNPDAAGLGQQIFFDPRFSANGGVSCATCHQPDRMFTDGLPKAKAIGTTARGTPTIVGTAYSSWFFWDGRRDSQWSQALAPMESAVEHGGNRTQYVHIIDENEAYRVQYEAIFGPMPDFSDRVRFPDQAGPVEDPAAAGAWQEMNPEDRRSVNQVFANLGKAIAAYERQIMPGPSHFDDYVQALLAGDEAAMAEALTSEEIAGLRLFIGQGKCTQCHNGPLLTNNGFHSVGVPAPEGKEPDIGRFSGVQQALDNEFNCLGSYSDAGSDDCLELRFAKTTGMELMSAFKVPTLRNVAETAPYMHAGQFATLGQVLVHYKEAPAGPSGHTDLQPLDLAETEIDELEAFLASLSGPLDAAAYLLAPPLKE